MTATRSAGVLRQMKSRGLRSLPETERTLAKSNAGFVGDTLDVLGEGHRENAPHDATEGDPDQMVRALLGRS